MIFHDPHIEDQVTAAHLVASELTAQGSAASCSPPCSTSRAARAVYWVYGFKTGTFWPFIPNGEGRTATTRELELKAKLERELPVEQDLTRWFGLFDAPI